MALAAMVDPLRIGVTILVISRPRPVLQLLAFWLGGLAMGLAVGLGALFLLRALALRLMADMPDTGDSPTLAMVEIGVGVLALLIAALVALRPPRRGRASGSRARDDSALSRLTSRAG